MSGKLDIFYLGLEGTFWRARGKIDGGFLVNHKGKQTHSLVASPSFPFGKGHPFETWEDLLAAPSPVGIPERRDRLTIVCEDDNVWPLAPGKEPDAKMIKAEVRAGALIHLQRAIALASRDDLANTYLSAAFLVIVGLVALMVVAMVLAFGGAALSGGGIE